MNFFFLTEKFLPRRLKRRQSRKSREVERRVEELEQVIT